MVQQARNDTIYKNKNLMIAEKIKDDQIRMYVNQEEYNIIMASTMTTFITLIKYGEQATVKELKLLKGINETGKVLMSKRYRP